MPSILSNYDFLRFLHFLHFLRLTMSFIVGVIFSLLKDSSVFVKSLDRKIDKARLVISLMLIFSLITSPRYFVVSLAILN